MGNQLTNSELAELLAVEAGIANSPFAAKALRKASRQALSWEVEAAQLKRESLPFTELAGVGPYIGKMIQEWFENPPVMPEKDPTRIDFLTKTEALEILSQNPTWKKRYRGDLQMHTVGSDGSANFLSAPDLLSTLRIG
jgi:hypothetical protein